MYGDVYVHMCLCVYMCLVCIPICVCLYAYIHVHMNACVIASRSLVVSTLDQTSWTARTLGSNPAVFSTFNVFKFVNV